MLGKRQKQKYEKVNSVGLDEHVDSETSLKKKNVNPACLWSAFITILLISIYYIPSVGLTFYQRWLLQSFHFPLSTVLIHMVVKYLLAIVGRAILRYRQRRAKIVLGWKEYVIAVAPTGIFSGIDIGFSNWGLELIKVSLYTMTKSTVIIFILFFSILFKLEKKSFSLCITVLMISCGLILFSYKATDFNTLGFILLLLASMSSGIRWTCVQLLLQNTKMDMKNPIDMIYYMQPWMILSLLPFAVYIEGPAVYMNCKLFGFTSYGQLWDILYKILVGAFIAFFMEITEVMVVTYTSSLTLSIAGILKELMMVILAVEWNGDQLSLINVIGLIMCLLGVSCHVFHKIRSFPQKAGNKIYDFDSERHELGEYLIDNDHIAHMNYSSDSEGERSDTQVLFDILNRHNRYS